MLNIYTPEDPHSDGFIVGDRAALIALRAALDEAISTGKATLSEFDSDGEGYTVNVFLESVPDKLTAPYALTYIPDRDFWIRKIWGEVYKLWRSLLIS